MTRAVRLSSVTFLRPTWRVELFGNIFATFWDYFATSSSLGTRTVCIKILGTIKRGSCKL